MVERAGELAKIAAATLFSTGGAAIKATALTGWQVASFRSGLAAVAVFLFVPLARKSWSPRVALVSLVYAATMVLFVVSNKATTAANAIFLQSTAPLYILLLAPWLLKEKPHRSDYLTMAALADACVFATACAQSNARTARPGFLEDSFALDYRA